MTELARVAAEHDAPRVVDLGIGRVRQARRPDEARPDDVRHNSY